MMIWTLIACGIIILMAFTFLYCGWRVRHLRTRGLSSSSVQVSAIIPEPQEHQHQQQLPKHQFGIEKEVLDAFPTIKANDLHLGMQEEENSQCPICLVEYEASEVLRRLPICGHIFHTSCVDSWLHKQPTCPVCRIILSAELSAASSSDHERSRSSAAPSTPVLETHYCTASSTISPSLTVGLVAPPPTTSTPSWVLVNRPLPLPPAATAVSSAATSSICSTKTFSSSSAYDSSGRSDLEMGNNNDNNFHHPARMLNESGVVEYPLLKVTDDAGSHRLVQEGWRCRYSNTVFDCCRNSKSQGDGRHKSCITATTSSGCNIQIESRGVKNHSINSRRWLTESFSFVLSDSFNADNVVPEHKLESGGRGAAAADQAISIDNGLPPATTAAAATTKHSTDLDSRASPSMDFGSRTCRKMQGLMLPRSPDSESVYESRISDSNLPLAISPEQCSFEFLPLVLTGTCSADLSFMPKTTHH